MPLRDVQLVELSSAESDTYHTVLRPLPLSKALIALQPPFQENRTLACYDHSVAEALGVHFVVIEWCMQER